MKTVKINFSGTYPGFKPEMNHIYAILKKHYDVKITDDADYILCDIFGIPYEYCKYDQIRIMSVGENYTPDFNLVDYAISRYPIYFQDRHFYLPGCTSPIRHWEELANKNREYSTEILREKVYFANFIAGHESEYGIRGDFFKKLCSYKHVEAPGKYLNNMPEGQTVQWTNNSKTDFQRKCKFTLCFESTKHEGFITEKITDAFYADTIPVYYGSSSITEFFNSRAFINCSDYDSFDEVVKKIIELDNDDEKYLEMLRQPILVDSDYPKKIYDAMEAWVLHIFEQPLEKAYRRSRVYAPQYHNDYLARNANGKAGNLCAKRLIKKLLYKIHR